MIQEDTKTTIGSYLGDKMRNHEKKQVTMIF